MLVVAVSAVLVAGCGSDKESASSGSVAESASEQLRYLDPQSSSVVAVDLRWDRGNWDDLKPLIGRLLKAYREELPLPERKAVPETAQNGIEQLAGFANLSFKNDIEPALDGHLVIGAVVPPNANPAASPSEDGIPTPAITVVYRTEKGDLGEIADRLTEGERRKPLAGYDDTVMLDDYVALVANKTLVATFGRDDGAALKAALDRAKDGGGFPAERLAEAERDTDMADPLVLAAGDLTVARQLLGEENLEGAREAVPYLRALRRGSAALDVTGDEIKGKARLVTDREKLTERDLPVAPAGELELPDLDDAVGGGSRNQSYTTTFGARLTRALFPDSRFVKAVERAEKELDIQFEDEVLRQFNCPSVSIFEPGRDDEDERFGARSCVDDPERMRELLPRLRPFLPDILTGLQGLGAEGLTALLLLAPDAPLVPGGPVAQIQVAPSDEGAADDELYEISGLRDDIGNPDPRGGPDTLVFGLIGDAFVVASDAEMAQRAAKVETEKLDRDAGSALRIPVAGLLARGVGSDEAKAAAKVFGDIVGTISATPEATVAEGTVELKD